MNTLNKPSPQSGMDRRIEPRPQKRLLMIGGGVAAVLVAIFLIANIDTSTSFTLDGQRIRTAEVGRGVFEDFIPLPIQRERLRRGQSSQYLNDSGVRNRSLRYENEHLFCAITV